MKKEHLIEELQNTRRYFEKTISVFSEEDSGFTPDPEIFTVAQHTAHAGFSVDWMLDGVFGKGWDMDFDAHIPVIKAVTSFSQAKQELARAFDAAVEKVQSLTQEELDRPMPADDPIMPNLPRYHAILGIADHTAHHRGALTIYARLTGKVPPMPYM